MLIACQMPFRSGLPSGVRADSSGRGIARRSRRRSGRPAGTHAANAISAANASPRSSASGRSRDGWIHISRRQHAIRIRPDAQVLHVIRNFDPSMQHAGRNDDDVAGGNRAPLAAHERGAVTRTHGHPHDLRIGRQGRWIGALGARDQHAGARQNVVDLGDLRVRDAADGPSVVRSLGHLQDPDADVELADVHDLDLTIRTALGRGRHGVDFGLHDVDGGRRGLAPAQRRNRNEHGQTCVRRRHTAETTRYVRV